MVMTLLTILFVAGIAFLATMSFESDLIDLERQRVRDEVSMDAVGEQVGAMLRNAVAVSPGVPFGGDLERPFVIPAPTATVTGPNSPMAIGELPNVHHFTSPIEPYVDAAGDLRFRGYTDLRGVADSVFKDQVRVCEPSPGWVSGVVHDWDDCPVTTDPLDHPLLPVDSDGDGVTDTLAFDVVDAVNGFGFSGATLTALSRSLNPRVNPDGRVFLGARVIAHGGMVNLNESHPNLIANVFDFFREVDDTVSGPTPQVVRALDLAALQSNGADLDYKFFRHSPTSRNGAQVLYSPWVEESLLRHRNLLPPLGLPMTLLQGNPTTDRLGSGRDRFGDADMPGHLFAPLARAVSGWDYETVHSRYHRYRPFSMGQLPGGGWEDAVVPGDRDAPPTWAVRMEPFTAYLWDDPPPGNLVPYSPNYDRRHLVTTTSHSDLLSRGAVAQVRIDPAQPPVATNLAEQDVRDLMRRVNSYSFDPLDVPSTCDPGMMPLEYPYYPHTIVDNGCAVDSGAPCRNDPGCDFDVRKGRLQLSLPWLDDRFAEANALMSTNPAAGIRLRDQMMRLIYDVFYLLVRNARGPHWDEIDCSATGTNGNCGTEVCDQRVPSGDLLCHDNVTGLTHREHLLTRTAASLTANMIDYMDCDGPGCAAVPPVDSFIPTRVALRRMDLQNVGRSACQGGPYNGYFCIGNADCGGGGGTCDSLINLLGRELDLNPPALQSLFVYGLERQPFITEITTLAAGAPPSLQSWSVEFYNPYADTLVRRAGVDEYVLVEVDAAGIVQNEVTIDQDIAQSQFTVFCNGALCDPAIAPPVTGRNRIFPLTGTAQFSFRENWTLYLVRRRTLPGTTWNVVVDQFHVGGLDVNGNPSRIGVDGTGLVEDVGTSPPFVYSMQRVLSQAQPWSCPVPFAIQGVQQDERLGDWNNVPPGQLKTTELQFADTQSLTRLHPLDADADTSNDLLAGVAFPTTGSMLMLMADANRDLTELTPPPPQGVTDLAFTTGLLKLPVAYRDPVTNLWRAEDNITYAQIQVDNGRMPVFDLGEPLPGGGRLYAHHLDPTTTAANVPGGVETLPWGQLVFDYFTALPLSSKGPYWNPDGTRTYDDPIRPIAGPDSIPRVDLNGLRVHGQINLNAAPWKVLSGLPMVPADRIPAPFQQRVKQFAELPAYCLGGSNDGLPCVDNGDCSGGECREAAGILGEPLAQAIVAYRELRAITDFSIGAVTGDYGDVAGGHGWTMTPTTVGAPAARRGPGFLSVGELLNLRHPAAATTIDPVTGNTVSKSRIDNYALDRPPGTPLVPPDYVEAIAKVMALGDWVTVRSHVFTVYGTLRGEYWDTAQNHGRSPRDLGEAQDVDSRAIRFQETVDRLPMFLGRPSPERIGERQVTRYMDVHNE